MGIKIQINDRNGVEKLIEADPDLKIGIKDSIINGFAKKYLKSVADDMIIRQLQIQIIDELKKTNYLGLLEKDRYGCFSESDKLSAIIKKGVENRIGSVMLDHIAKIEERVIDELKGRVEAIMSSYDEERLKDIMDDLVKAKMKALLNGR